MLANLVTRVAIIDKGRIVDNLTMEELYEKTTESLALKTTDDKRALVVLQSELGLEQVTLKGDGTILIQDNIDKVEDLVKSLVEAGVGVKQVLRQHKNLEDYYLEITKQAAESQ